MPDNKNSPARHTDLRALSAIISGRLAQAGWESFTEEAWEALIAGSRRQGVAPLLYWVFSQSGNLARLPETVRDPLRLSYARTLMQNQLCFRELESLSRAYAQARIPLVLLKGACYALTVYPDAGLRPMADLDVLVPIARLDEAVGLACSLGYRATRPEASPGLNELFSHEVLLQKEFPHPMALEVHFSLVADRTFQYAVSVDWFWEQVEPLDSPSAGRFENLLMLTPTAQVLYAASHAMLQHGGHNAPLRWFFDLDQLVRRYATRLDWELLVSQAGTFEWGSALRAALVQTEAYFETPIPPSARTALFAQTDRHAELVAFKQSSPETHILAETRALASLNWWGRLRLIFALLMPGPAYMRWRYNFQNNWLLPRYYLLRWWGIFKDLLRTLSVLLKRRSSTNA
ncbi:MAG: hypothetical protein HFACDABA_02040 [Anaerolineales bacterium]|nr:hypothetical protein [Anaerolineales bacterium]